MALRWVLLLEGVMALAMLAMSFSQPFPTPSRRASAFVLLLVLLMAIGEQAERPASIDVHESDDRHRCCWRASRGMDAPAPDA